MNDLTVSNIERQNVLNNRYAVDALQENLGFTGMLFEGEYRFTKKWLRISMKLKNAPLSVFWKTTVTN